MIDVGISIKDPGASPTKIVRRYVDLGDGLEGVSHESRHINGLRAATVVAIIFLQTKIKTKRNQLLHNDGGNE